MQEIKSNARGMVDLEELDRRMNGDVAALMLTNPNTLGVFESDICRIAEIVHAKGGLLYMDGANMNALTGMVRPGDMGVDVLHINLHKTFSTPHGGGGHGSGPVGVKKFLEPFLPVPLVEEKGGRFSLNFARPDSIGRVRGFYGNFLVMVRALAYILTLGPQGMREIAEVAVLNSNYIRKCLDNFATNSNVIQFTGAEFTGPLAFMEFWLDTVAEWERETGKHPLIALSCTKDVQDAVLADPKRGAVVDLIDFRYWWQTAKGLFAPPGGKNLAPRQFERQWKGGRPTDPDLARMAAEYRRQYPEKAAICDFDSAGWAFLCAGGSLPRLPRTTDSRLLAAIPRLQPWPEASTTNRWVLRAQGEYLVYLAKDADPALDLSHEGGTFVAKSVDPKTGGIAASSSAILGTKTARLPKSPGATEVFWLTRQ